MIHPSSPAHIDDLGDGCKREAGIAPDEQHFLRASRINTIQLRCQLRLSPHLFVIDRVSRPRRTCENLHHKTSLNLKEIGVSVPSYCTCSTSAATS